MENPLKIIFHAFQLHFKFAGFAAVLGPQIRERVPLLQILLRVETGAHVGHEGLVGRLLGAEGHPRLGAEVAGHGVAPRPKQVLHPLDHRLDDLGLEGVVLEVVVLDLLHEDVVLQEVVLDDPLLEPSALLLVEHEHFLLEVVEALQKDSFD